jgi:hypothetical protein
LKACVSQQTKQDDFPPKDAARYYTHDLTKLIDIAGFEAAFKEEAVRDPIFRTNWAIVKDWTEEATYQVERAWVQFEDAVVYRWNGSSVRGQMACDVTLDDLNRFWTAERRRGNLPAILIDLDGPQLTLHFTRSITTPRAFRILDQHFKSRCSALTRDRTVQSTGSANSASRLSRF